MLMGHKAAGKSIPGEWTAPFSMTLNDPKPRFQGHVIL